MIKTISVLIIASVLTMGGIYLVTQINDNPIQTDSIPIPQMRMADAASPALCSMSLDKAVEEAGFEYKSPKSLPSGYSLEDALGHKGTIALLYSPKKICGTDQTAKTYQDGILKFISETSEQNNEILKGKNYFEEFKKYSDYPERISIFEIDGKQAMGWESGMKKSFVKYDDGTIISEENIPYPAQIQIIDEENERFYVLKGYFQLDQLTQIARSIK